MSTLLAIDPGPTKSAWVRIDARDHEPQTFAKESNDVVLRHILTAPDHFEADTVAIEMVASYGMPVGAEIFDTCVWIGRFHEAVRQAWYPHAAPRLVYRREIKLHHCGSARANDANIRQALIDRFAPGQPNHGKGTKKAPGWFHGFHADVWQAYGLAVYAADQQTDPRDNTAGTRDVPAGAGARGEEVSR